jgi:hypothetical protein
MARRRANELSVIFLLYAAWCDLNLFEVGMENTTENSQTGKSYKPSQALEANRRALFRLQHFQSPIELRLLTLLSIGKSFLQVLPVNPSPTQHPQYH